MSDPYIHSPRLLPRCIRQDFIDLCHHQRWPLRTAIPRDDAERIPATLVFRQGTDGSEEKLVHWVDDLFVQFPYVVISGPDADSRARDLRADTDALTSTDVFKSWDTETDPQRLGVLAFYLGVMAPPTPDPEYRKRLLAGMNHVDQHVRACSMAAAIGYRAWPGWNEELTRLANQDRSEGIRDLARQLLLDQQTRPR